MKGNMAAAVVAPTCAALAEALVNVGVTSDPDAQPALEFEADALEAVYPDNEEARYEIKPGWVQYDGGTVVLHASTYEEDTIGVDDLLDALALNPEARLQVSHANGERHRVTRLTTDHVGDVTLHTEAIANG